MILIDTHSHIFLNDFTEDIESVIERASAAGVKKIIMPNINITTLKPMISLSNKYSGICLCSLGIHPTDIGDDPEKEFDDIQKLYPNQKYTAIGETGIDLYWDKTNLENQIKGFIKHIELAGELDLPLIIHTRDSFDITYDILSKHKKSFTKGVFHCFSGNMEQVQKAVELGFKIGVGGSLTFKNSNLPLLLKSVKIENIILETDAPYLAPMPYRGKRNEPSYLQHVADKLSEIYSLEREETGRITSTNASELFNLDLF